MILKTCYVDTTPGIDVIPIGHEVRFALRDAKAEEGSVLVVIPYGGAGLVLLEKEKDDPKLQKNDPLRKALEAYLPVASCFLPKTMSLPFEKGKLITDPWQDVHLIDYLKAGKRREYKVQVQAVQAPKETNEKNEQPF